MTGCDEWQTSVPDQEFIFELAPPEQDSAGKTATNLWAEIKAAICLSSHFQ